MILLDELAKPENLADMVTEEGLPLWAEACKIAQRFVIDRNVARAARDLCYSAPRNVLDAMPLARLPFPVIWIECRVEDRGDCDRPQRFRPARRIGAMIIEADPRKDGGRPDERGVMYLGWEDAGGGFQVCPVGMRFDLAQPIVDDPEMLEHWRKLLMDPSDKSPADYKRLSGDIEAAVATQSRFVATPSPFHPALWRGAKGDPILGRRMVDLTVEDWRGEPLYWLSVVMMMNCRNRAVETAAVPLEKLNRARARNRKAPLLDHSVVKLNLSRVNGARAAGGGTGTAHRLHTVRGHFKLRRSGIYWWNAYLRGDAALGSMTKTYQVAK